MKIKQLLPLVLCSLSLSAQQPAIQKFGITDGLASNYILDIAQDRNGYVWFATLDGLACFDGNKFSSFYHDTRSPLNSLSANALNTVFADTEQPLIWIGTQRNGLNAYNYHTATFTLYRHNPRDPQSIATNDITDIIDAGNGRLWISTYRQGVELMDKRCATFTHYNIHTVHGMPANGVWCMAYDPRTKLYLGQADNGLTIIDLTTRTARNIRHTANPMTSLADDDVRALCLDSYGTLWIGTHNGLSLFDTHSQTLIPLSSCPNIPANLAGNNIMSIQQIGDRIWVATEFNGVFVINNAKYQPMSASAFRTTHYTEGFSKDQLSCSSVFSVFNDTFGNVWLGTWGGGVNFISHLPQMFNCIVYGPNKDDETLTAKSAPGVCIAPNGDLWVGTEGGGINIFHSGHRIATLTQENGALPDNVLMTAHNDSHGALWFGTFSGWIYRFNASTRALQKVRILSGNHSDIRCFYENRDHQMCVGTSSGIFLLDLATMKTLKHYEISNSRLPEQLVRSICQDAQGRYWVGTFGNGMAVLSPDMQRGKWFNTNNHFCSNTINHIIQGRNYTMWAATDNGVVRFPVNNPDHYVCYQQQEGIANTNTHSLAEDRKGNIWVSSNKGLSCIATAQKRIYNFSNTSDIGYGEFCSDAVVTDPRGYIYFGYNGGVCFFNPNDAKPTSTLPPVRFTQIEVLKGTINNTGRFISLANEPKVTLHHDENTFSIGFNLRDNALRGRVYYAYRLKELNNTWFEVGHDQEVTFRNLPYGKYTLEVKARIDEQWSAPSAAVVIDIQPPFWSSAWARALYILLFLAVALEISRRYRRHLLRRNKYKIEQANREKETELNNERLRFYTNIAHELRTPLTLIIGPLDDMLRNYTLVDTLRHKIELVNKNANRLLELVTQILEFRKTETQNRTLKVARQNLPNVIKEEWLKFKEANKNPDLVFSIDLSDPNLTLYFDKEVVTIIIDNLLSNAVKYTLSGSIVTTMTTRREEEKTMVDVSIIDTGYGIDSEALPHLFDRFYQAGGEHQSYGTGIGLALVKSLSTLHQGTISVRSDVGKGSTFTFSLRIDNTYPEALHTDHEEPAALPEETPATTYSEPDDKRPLVIVVEDNTDIADYIKESLSEQYDVVTAPNGQVGLNKALQLTPDIVVSDVMMPVMDGIELCQQLKNDIRTSHIPVILLTAKDTLENKKEGYIAGADSYITKPFSSSLLLTRINNLLETRRKLAQKMDITQLSEKKEQLNVYINQHDNDFINRVSDIINDNLAEESLDITFVADRMNMSSSSLYRKMKALTGLSANAFIHKIKMNTAEKMLIERKLTISEIAFKLGFSSPSYFRHCFKDDYGIAPSDFVKRLSQTSKDKTSR